MSGHAHALPRRQLIIEITGAICALAGVVHVALVALGVRAGVAGEGSLVLIVETSA